MPKPLASSGLRQILHWGGALNAIVFLLLIPLSYGLAVVSPFQVRQTAEIAALQRLALWIPGLSTSSMEAVQRYLGGDSLLAEPFFAAVAYALPLLASTGVFGSVVLAIWRSRDAIDELVISLLSRWAVAFALINVLVYPIFTQDFWLSVVWGRMIADGQNPYYQFFGPSALAGTPLLNFPIRMTYGPLWGIVSALLTLLGGRNAAFEFLAFKLFLALAWILSLWLVRRAPVTASPVDRALGLCLFGWLPISFYMSVGEGHNDIVMILFFLIWMDLAVRGIHRISPLALVASTLIKYVTAPMAAVDLLHAWKSGRLGRPHLLVWALCAALSVGVFAVFWRGPGFFVPLLGMQGDKFLTPAHALVSISGFFHFRIPWVLAGGAFAVLFAGLVAHYFVQYFRNPGSSQLIELILAIQCAILFAVVNHIWPWFILWILAPAAMAIRSKMLRIVVPAAIFGPFLNLYWILFSGWRKLHYASILFCVLLVGGAVVLTRLTSKRLISGN